MLLIIVSYPSDCTADIPDTCCGTNTQWRPILKVVLNVVNFPEISGNISESVGMTMDQYKEYARRACSV